jgi:hypothetical protein
MQPHGGGSDGASQRAAPGLVHAGDKSGTRRAGRKFKKKVRLCHAAGCPDAAGKEKGAKAARVP